MFGFAALSLGIGALQLMLDRGELKDWFSSTEIQIEAVIAAVGLFLFIVHTATAENTFISRGLFKDRNFVIGSTFIFMIGVVLFATLALMPPMLQGLMGYPVLAAGLRDRPTRHRHLGFRWLVVGRLTGRVDARLLIAIGFGLGAISLCVDGQPSRRRSTPRRSSGRASFKDSALAWRMCHSPFPRS